MAEPGRPRLLIVTRNLPPMVGGMERLNWHMAEELAKAADVRIVGPVGSAVLAPDGIAVREAPLKPLWKFLLVAAHRARREAMEWKPDIVLAGSGLTAPLVLRAARACGARAAVYAHGLDVAVKHPVYRALWLPAIRRMHRVIANSRATAKLCRGIGVDAARVGIVHPGVELPQILSDASTIAQFRTRHGLGDRRLLLSVGRLSARKGLSEFVMHALPRIVAAHPGIMLLIVGDTPKHALHARAQSPESIRTVATQVGVADNLRFLGEIPDHELNSAYRAASVHVFPVRPLPGDPEGFGMVAVEAAAHGLPTVAFASGGVEDAVAQGQSGYLVQPGDYAAFAQRVIELLESENAMTMGSNSRTFAQAFTWERFGKDVLRLLLP
ncbi:MAG: glycosyltransferase family 4 protein [Xanthomonadaceae bacterium]|nr:glycosyltransferase family 4 protein [Xanthomonadaceae bacterium]